MRGTGKPYLGRVVIGGKSFPVSSVRLLRGKTVISFEIKGPQEPFTGPITIFGEDGTGCWQGKTWEVPEVAAGVTLCCDHEMVITELITGDQVFRLPLPPA